MNDNYSTFSFTQNIPYKLVETGSLKNKPLLIYLHGYKQNIKSFEKHIASLLQLPAHHLLLQGPYPIYDEQKKRPVDEWGRAWYLYDGRQEQFQKSMEASSVFIDGIIEKISASISYSQITLVGYSMGGYLAGYYALSRQPAIDNLIVIGGRIKTEWFADGNYNNLNALVLHGLNDKSVDVATAEKSMKELQNMGTCVTFKALNEAHRLNQTYIDEAKNWLLGACRT